MAQHELTIPRIEGHLRLVQADDGQIRVQGSRTRDLERWLWGREPRDAVFAVQTFCGDSGVSHALAATLALDDAMQRSVAPNASAARDLLHALSLLHAHLRNLYWQVLPDYLPLGALRAYRGAVSPLETVAERLNRPTPPGWAATRRHPFTASQADHLLERANRVTGALGQLQQMMAVLGGKFPVVMSLVPGGMTIRLGEADVLRLERLLEQVRRVAQEAVAADVLTLLQQVPALVALGEGGVDYLSAGSLGADIAPEAALFTPGAYVDGTVLPPGNTVSEALESSFYMVRRQGPPERPVIVHDSLKPGAYSWVKTPHLQGRIADVGPMARLAVGHVIGASSLQAGMVAAIEAALNRAILDANTVGGRLLARAGEVDLLLGHASDLLERLQPGQPFAEAGPDLLPGVVHGAASLEAPSGALQHRVVFEDGRIASYDIISPSTWLGAARHPVHGLGALELALNRKGLDLAAADDALAASRIVHSYGFSMTDAVQ